MTEHETFESFWGELLLLRFHAADPRRTELRRERAARLAAELDLHVGSRVLELGCGDGRLAIALAELGARVTAVDRLATVLADARRAAEGAPVDLVVEDLRRLELAPAAFDAVLCLDVIGLGARAEEERLFERVRGWLARGGSFLLDVPAAPAELESRFERRVDGGVLDVTSRYDPATRVLHIEPVYRFDGGRVVDLLDPYDAESGPEPGIRRFLWEAGDLAAVLSERGFAVRVLPHFHGETHVLLRADAV